MNIGQFNCITYEDKYIIQFRQSPTIRYVAHDSDYSQVRDQNPHNCCIVIISALENTNTITKVGNLCGDALQMV